MAKGIPLDDYLNNSSGMSDKELEDQLFPDLPMGSPQAAKSPSPAQPAGETGFFDFEDKLKDFKNSSHDMEAEVVDSAIKSASHGVKVLAPLLAAASRWLGPEDDAKIEDIMSKVLIRLQSDTALVIEAYGVDPLEAPNWLTSQVSGQIMEVLINAIDRNNGALLDKSDTRYLKPLLNFAKEATSIGGNFYNMPSDPDLQLANNLMLATSVVMTEYHAFNYFRPDGAEIAEEISDFLNTRVIEGTLDTLTRNFGLNVSERSYLAASLLKQAGNTLANAWRDNAYETLSAVKQLPAPQRNHVALTGCSLEAVYEDFENRYQALEMAAQSAIQTRAPHREAQYESKDAPSV